MRFALLGEGPLAFAVAHAVLAQAPAHRLIRQSRLGSLSLPDSPFAPGVRFARNWEELLTDADVDAVIVGGGNDELQPVVRQLVQAGKAVLVAPELVQSAAFFYELSLVESESPGRIFPMLGLRGHPLVLKLKELLSQGELGSIRHVQFDRKLASQAAAAHAPVLTPAQMASALLVDADLLRMLCGSYDQVTASRSGEAARGYSLATVMLAGSGVPQAVWTTAAHPHDDDWKLTISGEAGTAVLDGNPAEGRLRLTLHGIEPSAAVEECTADAGAWLLETFAASAAQSRGSENPAGSSQWDELARAVELVDAVERSVRRRRTIDVYFETPSERGIFKTQMTAVGCSLLMLTLAAVVFYLVLAATIELPPLMKRILVVGIFLPLGAFLALQFLVFVARPASRDLK